MWIRGRLLGLTAIDRDGAVLGRVVDTHPYDGSDPQFAVIAAGRFGSRALVPLDAAIVDEDLLLVPFTRLDVEDSPLLDGGRYENERIEMARGYWTLAGSH